VPAVPRLVELLLIIMALVGGLQAAVMIGVELSRYLNRSGEVASLSREVAQLERDIAALREVLARYDDERFREQLARKQGFVYPNEILYRMLR
jgi:cell division protein FtsB